MATIRKVKIKPGTVEIHSTTNAEKQESETIFKSFDDPHPDLVNAMNDLVKTVYNILGIPRDLWTGDMKVSGVSFSEGETSGISGAVITAQVKVEGADAPLILNTPHLPFEKTGPTSGGKVMERVDVERLERVREEAASFLTGKRAQLVLPGTEQSLTREKLDATELERGKRKNP